MWEWRAERDSESYNRFPFGFRGRENEAILPLCGAYGGGFEDVNKPRDKERQDEKRSRERAGEGVDGSFSNEKDNTKEAP